MINPTAMNITFSFFCAKSEAMQLLMEKAKKFALLDAPLLIQGETGSGKDVLAKACHNASPRASHKFIAVNCAGLPKDDAESEMFGRINGGMESIGFFEYANGGTVLLDGVAELPLSLQAKLLRFLNDGTFRRVGAEQEYYADVRVICTSQIPLQQAVKEGNMHENLFHRLNVLPLTVPPLRERIKDIEPLAYLFSKEICKSLNKQPPIFSSQFLTFLQKYPWPGNVRELKNALYRACSLSTPNQPLKIEDLMLDIANQEHNNFNFQQFEEQSLDQIMNYFEEQVLRHFYLQYPSTRKLAARLQVSHTAIANKLKQYGITK